MTGRNASAAGRNGPLVSVIVNCYNGARYLGEAIDSVLAQTYQDWEIIFWDNQSTDDSAKIYRSYSDPRLRYFYAPEHTLLYEARNHAIGKARGELLAFLDVDDWWARDKLEMQVPLFDDPEVGFACSNYWIVNEVRKERKLFRRRVIPSGWVLNELLMDYPVGMLTLMLRRAAFEGLRGGCDPRFHIIGDLDLVTRLAINWKMAARQEPLACYRIHGENEGQKHKARHVAEYEIWVGELEGYPDIQSLPGFEKVVNELVYMKGRLCLGQNKIADAKKHLRDLPWGRYKAKLWISFAVSSKLLRVMGSYMGHPSR